jgi:hypothetical protein
MTDANASRHTKPEQFQREERRIILSLGLLAIIVSLLINAITLRLPELLISLLFGLAAVWTFYAIDMIVYFSDDLFSLKTRLIAKQVGLRFLFILPIELLIVTAIFAIVQLNLPPFDQPLFIVFILLLPIFLINLILTPRISKAIQRESEK